MAAFCENGQSILITGRKVRSFHRLRNKKLAEIQRRQSKCQKGSRQWKKYERAKRYILSKSEWQLRDALHKTTKQFVDWCLVQSVSDVYIGKVEGVQRNTRKKKRVNRKQAQKLSNGSFGKVKQYLAYKLAKHGIRLKEVEESYTKSDMSCLPEEKKSIHPNLYLFLWIRRTSGHSWGPKHLEQSGVSKHHSLEGTD